MNIDKVVLLASAGLLLSACGGGGGGGSGENPPVLSDETSQPGSVDTPIDETPTDETPSVTGPPSDAESASYSVTVESFWFVEDYPQGFPVDAHLSYIGGATHNAAVSFWEPGGTVSPGMEDMAETGRISLFLADDVTPAIENGTADSTIARREYIFSSPEAFADGNVNVATFDVEMQRAWPRVTLVTMLGPSPDWFVGVDGLPLYEEGAWRDTVAVDLPLYDGGSKSGMEPIMGGPDIVPLAPIELIAYDPLSGTYGPSDTPQNLARVSFRRTR